MYKSVNRKNKTIRVYVGKGTVLSTVERDKLVRWYPNYSIICVYIN